MIKYYVLLILSTAIWGMGFIATRWTLNVYDPTWANAFRYTLAAIVAFPVLLYWKSFTRSRQLLIPALIAGTLIYLTLHLQTVGLKTTSVAKSGFITCLYVIITPFLEIAILKKRYTYRLWLNIFLALVGVFLLCNGRWGDINEGDLYTLACAFFAGAHIFYIGIVAHKIKHPVEFNFLQCFFAGIIATVLAFIFSGPMPLAPLYEWHDLTGALPLLGFIILTFFSSFMAFSFQVFAQKKVSSSKAAIIFLLESPFAALFGNIFLGETLTPLNMFGCALIILASMFVGKATEQVK